MNKIFFYISMTTIISAGVFLLIILFWLLYPYKTIEFNKPVAEVETKEVERGDYLIYILDYCKYTDVEAEISRSFVDGLVYLTPDGIADQEKGCGTARIQIYIPKSMPVGEYQIKQIRHYQLNPIREETAIYYTEKFKVL